MDMARLHTLYDRGVSTLRRFDVRTSGLGAEAEREIGARLLEGALIVYPTDTLYAIGCRAKDGAAVRRLREAKGREAGKPLPVIAADLAQAQSLAASWPRNAQLLADAFWPGPLTLVIPASLSALPPELLAGATSVAVRVPASELARSLARRAGPLVATSANLAGDAPCVTVDLALAAFPLATLAIDMGPLDGTPSTMVGVGDSGVTLLREGRIDVALIEKVLGQRLRAIDRPTGTKV
jgi:L-threonylcarbamoyladenylate synthase